MGMLTEGQILAQSKKAQGETNERLERLIVEQQQTNVLLAQVVQLLSGRPVVPPPNQVTWGTQPR